MSATLESASHRIVSNDETIVLEATHTPGYTHQIEIEERWPKDMDRDEVWGALAGEIAEEEQAGRREGKVVEFDERGQRRWLSGLTPSNSLDRLDRIENFRGIIDGLGYQIDVSSRRGPKNLITRKTCRYPSVERINDFTFDVFGGEGVEFASYDGGDYGVEEFMRPFADEGKVLVGSKQPYEIHDLSDHALGWIGLDQPVLDKLRSITSLYLERNDAEVALLKEMPPLTYSGESPMDHEQTRQFFNPSMTVLTEMLSSFDRQTDHMAEDVFYKESRDGIFRTKAEDITLNISHVVGWLFSVQSSSMSINLPHGLLGEGPDVDQTSRAIYNRYVQADAAGREMAANR